MIDKTEPFSFIYVKTDSQVDQQIEHTIKNSNHTIKENYYSFNKSKSGFTGEWSHAN